MKFGSLHSQSRQIALAGLLAIACLQIYPLAVYGPPTPETPVVKPDWYLLWIFGFLKLIPAGVSLTLGPVTIGRRTLGSFGKTNKRRAAGSPGRGLRTRQGSPSVPSGQCCAARRNADALNSRK